MCSAFVNGTQVPFLTDEQSLTPTSQFPFVANSGLSYIQNDYFPFMVGTDNFRPTCVNTTTGVDLAVYGLRLSNTIRYQNNGRGKPQQSVASATALITDHSSYFTNDAHTIAYLQMTDNPATALRTVSVQHGSVLAYGGVGSGLFMNTAASGGIIGNAVRDLCIQSSNGHGQAISIGSVLEMTVENVKATGGFHGIGAWNMFATYNIYVRNCDLHGYDSPYYGCLQLLIYGRDIYCLGSGRATIRLVGCGGNWANVFVASPAPNAECIFQATWRRIRGQSLHLQSPRRLRGLYTGVGRHLLRSTRLGARDLACTQGYLFRNCGRRSFADHAQGSEPPWRRVQSVLAFR